MTPTICLTPTICCNRLDHCQLDSGRRLKRRVVPRLLRSVVKKLLFVVNGGATRDVSVIDPASGYLVDAVDLGGGKLEEFAFDGEGRGFVNETGRLFLPTGRFGQTPAPTAAVSEPRAPLIPGSFAVIVVAP